MPRISVISIAKNQSEFEALRRVLDNQTFRDFEFVTSTKRAIPEAWNDAISRAKGEFFVFTETDAVPLTDRWLEEIARSAKRGSVLKGLEIGPSDLNMCNLVCDASIFRNFTFDEHFSICEDTELFARLRKAGVMIAHINGFPVVHSPSESWRKSASRGLRSGMYYMKISYLHGRQNIENVSTRRFQKHHINPISSRLRIIVENGLVIFGLCIGAIRYLPDLLKPRSERIVTDRRDSE